MTRKSKKPETTNAVNAITEAIHAFRHAQEVSSAFWNNMPALEKRLVNELGIYENAVEVFIATLYLYKVPSYSKVAAARWYASGEFVEGYDVANSGRMYGLESITYERWLGWMCAQLDSGKVPLPPDVLKEHYIRSACAFSPHYTVQ